MIFQDIFHTSFPEQLSNKFPTNDCIMEDILNQVRNAYLKGNLQVPLDLPISFEDFESWVSGAECFQGQNVS